MQCSANDTFEKMRSFNPRERRELARSKSNRSQHYICRKRGKGAFDSIEKALRWADKNGYKQYAYKCPCGFVHLTSQPQ